MVISKQVERPVGEAENIELVAHEADMAVSAMSHLPEAFAMGRQTAEFSGLLIKSGTEISNEAASSVALNVSMVASMFQVENKEVLKAAHEGETTALGNVMVAHEGVKEVLKAGWENLKKLFRAAANSIKSLINSIHSKLFKIEDKLKELSKSLKKIKAVKDEDLEINERALVSFKKEFVGTLSNKGQVDSTTIGKLEEYFKDNGASDKTLADAIKTLAESAKSNTEISISSIITAIATDTLDNIKEYVGPDSKIVDAYGQAGLSGQGVRIVSTTKGKITAVVCGEKGSFGATKLYFSVITDDINKAHMDRLDDTKKDYKFMPEDLVKVIDAAVKKTKTKATDTMDKVGSAIEKVDEKLKEPKKLSAEELVILGKNKNIIQTIASPIAHVIKTREFDRYRKVVAILNFGEAALEGFEAIKKKNKKKDDEGDKKETPKQDQNSDDPEVEAKAALAAIADLY